MLIQSNPLNDHTAVSMEYVRTAALLWGFKSEPERGSEQRDLLFGSRKNVLEKREREKKK